MTKWLTGAIGVGAIVLGWFYWWQTGDDPAAEGPGQSAIVEQPSGRIVIADEATGSGAGGSVTIVDAQTPSSENENPETPPTAEVAAETSGEQATSTTEAANPQTPASQKAPQASSEAASASDAGTAPVETSTDRAAEQGSEATDLAALVPATETPTTAEVEVEATAQSVETATQPGGSEAQPGGDTATQEIPEQSPDTQGTNGSQAEAPAEQAPGDAGAARFDVVRVDQDGQIVIAGTAEPGQKVEILLDGAVVGAAEADGNGAFVTVLFADLGDSAQQLQLRVPSPEPQPEAAPRTASNAEATGESTQIAAAPAADQTAQEPQAEPAQTVAAEQEQPANSGQTQQPPAEVASDTAAATETRDESTQSTQSASAEASASSVSEPATEPDAKPAAKAEADPETSQQLAVLTPSTEQAEQTSEAAATTAQVATEQASTDQNAQAPTPQNTGNDQAGDDAGSSRGVDLGALARAEAEPVATPKTDDETVAADTVTVVNEPAVKPAVAAVAPDQSTEPAAPRIDEAPEPKFALSAPVIILPSSDDDTAPALVQPGTEGLTILQPGGGRVEGVVLDRISYGEQGEVKFSGRGKPGKFIRVYGNAQPLGMVQVGADGTWAWSMARPRAERMKLFRFDQLDPGGNVASRIETPFEYASLSPQVLRERKIVIQKGDVLWRIAEQYYGEGLRYSMIYGANSRLIRDPDLIYPGQVFTIPELVDAN